MSETTSFTIRREYTVLRKQLQGGEAAAGEGWEVGVAPGGGGGSTGSGGDAARECCWRSGSEMKQLNTFSSNVALLVLCCPLFTSHLAFLSLIVCQICLVTS